MDNFYATVYSAILRLIPFTDLKAIVIASPGFTRDTVCEWLSIVTPCPGPTRTALRLHLCSGHPNIKQGPPYLTAKMGQSALDDVACPRSGRSAPSARGRQDAARRQICEGGCGPGQVSRRLAGGSCWTEADGARFHKMLANDELRAWYGPQHVALAVDRGAVGTLLISDELFRYVLLTMSMEGASIANVVAQTTLSSETNTSRWWKLSVRAEGSRSSFRACTRVANN
jgi:protein pelota